MLTFAAALLLQPPPVSPFTDEVIVTVSAISSPLPAIANGYSIRASRIPLSQTWYGRDGDFIVQIVRNAGAGSPDNLIHFSFSKVGQTTWGSFNHSPWNVNNGLPTSATVTTGTINPNLPGRNLITYTATITPAP